MGNACNSLGSLGNALARASAPGRMYAGRGRPEANLEPAGHCENAVAFAPFPRSAVPARQLLDEPGTLRPNSQPCASWDHGQHSVSCSERRLGYGYGVSVVSIARRLLALSPLSAGDRMLQVTNCVPAHAVRVAAQKARPSSGQAGPAITSALSRSRQASAWPTITIDHGGGKRRDSTAIALTGIYGFYIMGTAQKIGNSPCQSA